MEKFKEMQIERIETMIKEYQEMFQDDFMNMFERGMLVGNIEACQLILLGIKQYQGEE